MKSLLDFTFSLPLRVASSMEAVRLSVVVVGGISLITTVDSSFALIFARTFTELLAVLVIPAQSINSARQKIRQALERLLLQDRDLRFEQLPETHYAGKIRALKLHHAMPSVPSINVRGSLHGSVTGSLFVPS